MRILYVMPYVPSLVRIRPFNFIKYLAQRHEVTVLALQQDEAESEHVAILQPYCERIETVRLPRAQSMLNCLRALPTSTPLQGAYCCSETLLKRVRQLLAERPYDLVHVEHLRGAFAARSISGVACIYDSVDCISLLLDRVIQNAGSPLSKMLARLELPRTRRYESAMVRRFDHVLVTSSPDKEALERLRANGDPTPISVVPNGVHLAYPTGDSMERDPNAIVFSGKMSYHPNVDAVQFFCKHVLPIVRQSRPNVTFTIVGSTPVREVKALGTDSRVRVTGHVPDVRPYLRRAAIAVVPVRYAVGIQNKVLEAMAMGTPVIATGTACRPLTATKDVDFLEADDPAQFAAQVIRILEDAALRERIGANGRRYVELNHEWSAIVGNLSAIYEEVVAIRREATLAKL